MLIVQDD